MSEQNYALTFKKWDDELAHGRIIARACSEDSEIGVGEITLRLLKELQIHWKWQGLNKETHLSRGSEIKSEGISSAFIIDQKRGYLHSALSLFIFLSGQAITFFNVLSGLLDKGRPFSISLSTPKPYFLFVFTIESSPII